METFNLDKLCRVCLKESTYRKHLVETLITYQNDTISLLDVLNSFLVNKVVKTFDSPITICFDCHTNAIVAYHFKRLCNDSQNTLGKYTDSINSVQIKEEAIDIKEESNFLLNYEEDVQNIQEMKQEADEDVSNFCLNESEINNTKEFNENDESIDDKLDNKSENLEDVEYDGKLGKIKIDFPCQICDDTFDEKSSLLVHCKDVHGVDRPKIKKMHYCTLCEKGFKKPSVLELHFRTHTGEKPYLCSLCGKTFSSSPTLRSHFLGVHKRKEHQCSMCDKHFSTWACLKRHKRIHTGERSHVCKKCNASFYRSDDLKNHEKNHTGEKPCICKACGKGFVSEHRLKVHSRTHTPAKSHVCETCGSAFSIAAQLKYHIKKQHGAS